MPQLPPDDGSSTPMQNGIDGAPTALEASIASTISTQSVKRASGSTMAAESALPAAAAAGPVLPWAAATEPTLPDETAADDDAEDFGSK